MNISAENTIGYMYICDPMRVTNMVSINEAIFCCISNSYKIHTYNNHILCVSQSNGKTAVIYRILPKSDTFVIQVCDTNLRSYEQHI